MINDMTDLTDRLAEVVREQISDVRCYCLRSDENEYICGNCTSGRTFRANNARRLLAEYDAIRAATRDHDDADKEEAER